MQLKMNLDKNYFDPNNFFLPKNLIAFITALDPREIAGYATLPVGTLHRWAAAARPHTPPSVEQFADLYFPVEPASRLCWNKN
jgi:hypothetical protein